jgi:chemotaxis protein MotB
MAQRGALRRSFTPRLVVSLASSLAVHGLAVGLLFEGGTGPGSSPSIVLVDLVATGEPSPPTPPATAEPSSAAPDAGVAAEPAATEAAPLAQVQELAQANEILEQESEALRAENAEAHAEREALRTENIALQSHLAGERERVAALEREIEAERRRREDALAEQRRAHAQLVAALREELAGKDVALREATQGLTLSISDRVLFPSGQATLTAEGQELVDKLARALADVRERRILIEGHTDNVPIGPDLKSRYPSNWELSTARAGEVVRQLTARGGIPAERLLAAGRADTEPAASNATEEGRQQNRRIEIILLPATPAAGDDRG